MYPVAFESDHEAEGRSRLKVLFRVVLAIPLAIVNYVYSLLAEVVALIAWFAILLTGRYPDGLFDFAAGYVRFVTRMNGYLYLLTDRYPPIGGRADDAYPIRVRAERQESYSRLTTFFRFLLLIPAYLVLMVWGIAALVVVVIAWFALLFTAKLPDGMYGFASRFLGFSTRVLGYQFLLADRFPPIADEPQVAAPPASA